MIKRYTQVEGGRLRGLPGWLRTPLARSDYPGMSKEPSRVCKAYSKTTTSTRGVLGGSPGRTWHAQGHIRAHVARSGFTREGAACPESCLKLKSTAALSHLNFQTSQNLCKF